MPEFTCTRCGTALAAGDPRGTLDVEFLNPRHGDMNATTYVLCPDCYGEFETFLE